MRTKNFMILALCALSVLTACGGANGTTPDPDEEGREETATLTAKVSQHTTEVLEALKKASVDVKWVQVGNETRNGMLWDAGRLWTDKGDIADGWKHYAQLSNAGYDAVRKIYPSAKVIVHLNNAYEDNGWWFRKFKEAGGKFDVIGLSHYPMADNWSGNSKLTADECNALAISHIKSLASTFSCDVIVTEVGVKPAQMAQAQACLSSFMDAARGIARCAGVFYWEPEVDGVWKPAGYNALGWGAYAMGAFGKDGRPTALLDSFKTAREGWARGADVSWVTEMEKDGRTFQSADGKTGDLFRILKDLGMTAVRLRVWVDPDGGWCATDDVVAKARRASEAGLDIMIDFHYSSFFADPSRQDIPAAWKNLPL
ncbi:MAG: glycosyl hydrolase 53 family protein [Bacteroidales bacterium]|nr:glycosyl hydrolase 53 family protein [Bacteroidales bacterium]